MSRYGVDATYHAGVERSDRMFDLNRMLRVFYQGSHERFFPGASDAFPIPGGCIPGRWGNDLVFSNFSIMKRYPVAESTSVGLDQTEAPTVILLRAPPVEDLISHAGFPEPIVHDRQQKSGSDQTGQLAQEHIGSVFV